MPAEDIAVRCGLRGCRTPNSETPNWYHHGRADNPKNEPSMATVRERPTQHRVLTSGMVAYYFDENYYPNNVFDHTNSPGNWLQLYVNYGQAVGA